MEEGLPSRNVLLSQKEIEKLGRQRPETFKSRLSEIGFCFSLLASMFMAEYMVSGFNIILPTLATALDIPLAARTWPASVFSLVTGALLLPFGRLADIYGSYAIFVSGLVWFTTWSLIAGFSQNYIMLVVCRALQGLGPAAFLPSGIMLLGSIYRPGPRKNLVFSLYGASAPVGFFSGIFFAGISGQYLPWGWYFWIGAIILSIITVVGIWTIPSEEQITSNVRMDWWGVVTIVPGLLLVVYAITDSSHTARGWQAPQIYLTFVIGIVCLVAAFYVEGWVAENPLLPFDLFSVKYMKPLLLSLFFAYGVFGIYLFYASFYIEDILGVSALRTVAWFAPMAIGGLILATISGFTLHLLPGKLALVISGGGFLLSVLLFAIIPSENPSYWAYVFPAMLAATLGADVTYSVSNVFITTSLPKNRQGLAGAVINSVLFLGISFFLGIADLAVNRTEERLGTEGAYRVAFWFGLACAACSIVLMVGFVKIGKAKSDLTYEEKAQMQASALEISTKGES
ncbi:MFS multidrug transporter [Phlyctema vagabunda]|uniref:MFS multidrug transporter n=1 Tax=Phlyctema vagabunda TaxID=108571 RepID=A0ABR4PEE7_9HELO